MSDKISTGRRGEQLAEQYLNEKGYGTITRNYRYKHAEIDLIVQKDNFLVFVEVKTRKSRMYGEPESFVTKKKAEKIFDAAENYIFETDWQENIRFDIVAIVLNKPPEIRHFEDAFY